MLQTINITPDFYWLGALDPTLRTFDIIMETEFGTTYNSYLLKGSEGIAVFETVKEKFFETYLAKLQTLINPEDITYIVVNHTEPDHAGSVAKLLQHAPNATVVGSPLAIKYLGGIINAPFKSQVVKEGDTLSLGNKTLHFMSTPCLHWPDTMYSYIQEDNILVTCDSFGAHYCDENVLKSTLPGDKEQDFLKAYRYYFDMIMGPFKPFVQNALAKIKDLELNFICPGHGMVLERSNMQTYIDLYNEWSKPAAPAHGVVIAYVSAYGYTKMMAEALYDGLNSSGYTGPIHLCNLETESVASVVDKINQSEGLLIGSPTLLADALPPVWQVLTSLNPVLHKHLHVGCFGSYGWSGEALTHMEQRLKQLKCPMPLPTLGITFKPSVDDLENIRGYAKEFAASLIK